MIFTIDIGNSRLKVGQWLDNELIYTDAFPMEAINHHLEQYFRSFSFSHTPAFIIWANVGVPFSLDTLPFWSQLKIEVVFIPLDVHSSLPIKNLYASPRTLGVDRILAVIGARRISPAKAVLVIDAGTALTFDYATEKGEYLGGGISPGLFMRFQALHSLTAKLPLVEPTEDFPLIGNTTTLSIRSGVSNGIIAEIEGIIDRYKNEETADMDVFFTGGDAPFLQKHIKSFNFVDQHLLLRGMYATFLHNNP